MCRVLLFVLAARGECFAGTTSAVIGGRYQRWGGTLTSRLLLTYVDVSASHSGDRVYTPVFCSLTKSLTQAPRLCVGFVLFLLSLSFLPYDFLSHTLTNTPIDIKYGTNAADQQQIEVNLTAKAGIYRTKTDMPILHLHLQ